MAFCDSLISTLGTAEVEEHPTKPPKPLIPLAGNHITFPLTIDPTDQVVISWSQGNQTYTAKYYQIRCWFGEDTVTNTKPVFNVLGTVLPFPLLPCHIYSVSKRKQMQTDYD